MICPNCEKEIADNIAQCPQCGCHFALKEDSKPEVKLEPYVEKEPPKQKLTPEYSSVPKPEPPAEKEQPQSVPIQLNVKEASEQELKPEPKPHKDIQQPENEVTVLSKVCPNCNKTINNNATFCKWCGSRVAQEIIENKETQPSTKICKKCSKSITSSAAFCKYCGSKC